MNLLNLHTAVLAAEEFIERATRVGDVDTGGLAVFGLNTRTLTRALKGSKQSAACRRASMDLTRALAELRATK